MSAPIPRPVWFLGWVSLLTDAATEMIYPLLPVYLSRVLGASALSLGVIEGVAEGVNSLLKIVSGWLSDQRGRRRPLVILGYALSSAARPLIALSTAWPQVLAIRVLDRTGKGIRGAPRDAMLAQLAETSSRGRIFGFHRAMDHTGAIIGPLIATLFLFFLPGEYRLLFALATSRAAFIALFLIYGVHFALAEGAEKALVADLTPAHRRGAAFGLYQAALGVGALIASVGFGFLYERFSPGTAFITGAALAGAATVLLLVIPTK